MQQSFRFVRIIHSDALHFQVTYQLKLFTTTIFSVLFLNRQLSIVQWVSQVVLFIGVAAVQLQEQSGNSSSFTSTSSPSMIGLAAVIFASLLSGFSAVYFEKVIQTIIDLHIPTRFSKILPNRSGSEISSFRWLRFSLLQWGKC